MTKSTCAFSECTKPSTNRRWCHNHYEQLRKRGELPPKPCKGCGGPCPGAKHFCAPGCKPQCAVAGCKENVHSRGWCGFHYTRWKITGNPATPLARTQYEPGLLCSFPECRNKRRKFDLCNSHDAQWRKGDELTPLRYKSKSYTCVFCGGPSGLVVGFRKYCSAKCQRLYYRHGAPLPDEWGCVLCGEMFPHVVDGRRRVKFDAKMCNPCRSNAAKHGYSAAQLAKRDGTDCKLCGESVDMTLKHPDLMRGSVDHIIPTSLGGSNEPDNVQLAHLHCNIRKNNRVEVPLIA